MGITLSELASRVGGEVVGDGSVVITGVAGIREAGDGDLTFLSNPKYDRYLSTTAASAVVVDRAHAKSAGTNLLVTDEPYAAFAGAIAIVSPQEPRPEPGVHPSAVVSPSAVIGDGAAVGATAVVMDGASVGGGAVVHPGAYLGPGVSVGERSVIHANATLRAGCSVGDDVIVHSGTVVGADGFGFALDARGGEHRKVPQIGTVVIEDAVEIGSNVCIDRATLGETRIGRGTKIDNLVQIGHNVVIGEGAVIVAQVGISGSTRVGDGVVLAGQAGITGHIEIGRGAVVGAQSGVTGSVPPGAVVSGYPARDHGTTKRLLAGLQRLPDLFRRVRDLEGRLKDLEED